MITRLLSLFFATLIMGCASEAHISPQPDVPKGQVAVVSARFSPLLTLNPYAKGQGTAAATFGAAGVGGGALVGAIVPLQFGPLYPFIAPVTIIAGALIGGLAGSAEGAIHGLPADQASITRTLAQGAADREGIQYEFASLVASKLAQRGRSVILVADDGPGDRTEKPRYANLIAGGADGVLEVSIMSIGMAAVKGDPPRVALEVAVRTRSILAKQTHAPDERFMAYWSRPVPVADWVVNDNKLLVEQIKAALEALSIDTADVYFPIPLGLWWEREFQKH